MNAGELFQQQMRVAELREQWQAELVRIKAITKRAVELIPIAPCRELCNLLEDMHEKFFSARDALEEPREKLYDDLGGDVAFFDEPFEVDEGSIGPPSTEAS
jgi:hypothetical protein